MNYLTEYYKNLCEQLQAKVYNLEKLLETTRKFSKDELTDAYNFLVKKHKNKK